MDVEGKGFVIKDRRSFDKKGDLREEKKEEETKQEPLEKAKEKAAQETAEQRGPLPEVNFNSLIFSLNYVLFTKL